MEEKRRETRKKVMKFTPVYDEKRGGVLGFVGDITLRGVLIIGEKPLDVNMQTILRMELPDDLPGITATQLTIPARVARCVPDEDAGHSFLIGCEFTTPTPEQQDIIRAVLERYHFRHKLF